MLGLLDRFNASDLFAEMAAARSRRHEVPFAFTLDGRVIRVFVHALYQSCSGEWFLVDFKTDGINAEDVAKKTDEYLVQLGLHQAGIEEALEKSPKVIVYYLFPRVPIEIDKDRPLEAQAQVDSLFSGLRL